MKAGRQLLVGVAVLAVSLCSVATVLAGDEEPPRIQWQKWAIEGERRKQIHSGHYSARRGTGHHRRDDPLPSARGGQWFNRGYHCG